MRYLIISDLHSNFVALEAVLADAEERYDQAVCLGDLVGYGGEPNAVIAWARQAHLIVIRGNHDRACTGDEIAEHFSPNAQSAAHWTRQELDSENAAWLRNLPPGPLRVDGFQIVHGSPRDEDEYLIDKTDAAHIAKFLSSEVCFFGHTHLQGGFAVRRGKVWPLERPRKRHAENSYRLEPDTHYLLNPGSVGQPRDRDWRAAYALYESESRTLILRRCEYDVSKAQERIVDAKLPRFLAKRLEEGI